MPRYRPDGSLILYKQSQRPVWLLKGGERHREGVASTYLDEDYDLCAVFMERGQFQYVLVDVTDLDVDWQDAERLSEDSHWEHIERLRAEEARDNEPSKVDLQRHTVAEGLDEGRVVQPGPRLRRVRCRRR